MIDHWNGTLLCGGILLHGPVWTHLEGGNQNDLVMSYRSRTNTFQISERAASVAYFRVLPSKVSPQEPPHGFHDTRN
jgi:hypothetical protein